MSSKASLSATNLAVHHHLNCDLYLHNVYHSQPRLQSGFQDVPELSKAQFQRGNDWEESLFAWLDHENLLLRVPSAPVDPDCLLENIQADNRNHFFIAGLTFRPPHDALKARFVEAGTEPIIFGLAKPDLLEIIRIEAGVRWRVIDAKASAGVKTSHHVQIYFYTLCLDYLLPRPFFQHEGTAAVWLPPPEGFKNCLPSFNDLKAIKTTLLSTSLDEFLFERLPNIISVPREEVKWHYNPLCHNCPYEYDCKVKALHQGELGAIPNISLDEARTLKGLLRIASSSLTDTDAKLTDIEDLHDLIAHPVKLENIAKRFPSTVKRSRRILALPKKNGFHSSPVVESIRKSTPQIKPRRNLACPRQEDIAIIMSFVQTPSTPGVGVEQYTINVISSKPLPVPDIMHGPGAELISTLASLIQSIIGVQSSFSPSLRTQFYVWSPTEHSALQAHLINSALTSAVYSDAVRVCIGALAQGASLLQTTFQPMLLSGALLSFLSNSKRTKAEHKACLERMGLSTEGTADELRRRVDNEIKRLQAEGGRGTEDPARDHAELGQLPRVVVLKREIERLVALPVPGYWDLPECAVSLLPMESPEARCPSDEEVFATFRTGSTSQLHEILARRNASTYAILLDVRGRITRSGYNLLVNDAGILSANFMDICRQEHLRKLFFMQQFEVLTKLNDLWRSRLDGCPDSPVLQFVRSHVGATGLEHVFHLVSGALDMPAADRSQSMFDKIIVLDEADGPGSDVPQEALFDDLAVSGLVFPLNRYTRAKWASQHPTVQSELLVADLRDILVDGNRTKVVIQAWGSSFNFKQGRNYRLSPRLVDFNTSKILAALLEMDLRCVSDEEDTLAVAHHDLPLLQMILDPAAFGKNTLADEFTRTEKVIQKMFRDLKDLGSEAAGSLILKSSQHRATQRILSNRLSVIWGPPGTGKTYTIALSLLRLLDVQHRHGDTSRKIIFITAMTHAAIAACQTQWLERVVVEQVLKGNDHPAPSASKALVHIYTGTIYQLYNFTKRYSFQVDCVVIDEAGQLSLGSIALVLRSLSPAGRIVIAGDSEQLAPILSAQYPQLKTRPLFGSVLDCLMNNPAAHVRALSGHEISADSDVSPSQESIVQLTENFRLNPDLGEFVSTIYSRAFKPQKVQARQLARNLKLIDNDAGRDLGIEPGVLRDVEVFLSSLSKVMLREPQTVLLPPSLHSLTSSLSLRDNMAGGSVLEVPHPISLALIKLHARAMRSGWEDVGYEVHVRGEAAVAAALVASIQRCSPSDDIFVATPHRVQREAVRAALARVGQPETENNGDLGFGDLRVADREIESDLDLTEEHVLGKVTVDTIERLQGSEASFVVCLFSVPHSSSGAATTDLGFLLERRRLNVAISRAKTLCILVTSQEVLRPRVNVLANEETAKGYAFLKAFEDRAWSCDLNVDLDKF
ncbi:hypothetical protein Hypma_007621 [Hypsizygus marmoreus]|uniref:DNA2/NAM7 helicase-like C-terminal domain-containing protein n=1 Tax=Hypsizygus marmoreus TaxID=39966 RepID=A0A369JV73_HYPMA|nr:hypothetical protein Hypma_007621 [Hypsizygus marmoreus]